MFRKLLIKLTLLNASVIAILFFFLIAGVYLFVQYDTDRHSKNFLSRVASDINAGRRPPMFPGPASDFQPGPPPGPPPGPSPDDDKPRPIVFYAKLDPTGIITDASPSLPLPRTDLEKLVNRVGGGD